MVNWVIMAEIDIFCPLCGATVSDKRLLQNYWYCVLCDVYFLSRDQICRNTEVSATYDKAYYARGGTGVLNVISRYLNTIDFSAIVRLSKKCQPVLDAGCGDGSLLLHLIRKGVDAYGADTSASAIQCAVESGVPSERLRPGGVTETGFSNRMFGTVVSLHVLEHVTEPSVYLKGILGLLKPGGFLIIRVPNVDSIEAKLGREKWLHYDYPYHVAHYTPESLKRVLEKCGFQHVVIRYNATQYRQSLLYSVLYALGVNKLSTGWKVLLLPLQILFIPVSIMLAVFFRDSGIIEAVAAKSDEG
ncbi:class I SAM-dependent methyltransferase [Candidatus Parcubacteria bacterium]|nr:MAG: class I SAM-dependent methyltransferase [Candidatus Parcubacteria bacterium]